MNSKVQSSQNQIVIGPALISKNNGIWLMKNADPINI